MHVACPYYKGNRGRDKKKHYVFFQIGIKYVLEFCIKTKDLSELFHVQVLFLKFNELKDIIKQTDRRSGQIRVI